MRPISYIGYLDGMQEEDAQVRMAEMMGQCVKACYIDGVFWIYHRPEADDLKPHFHVLVVGECAQKCRVAEKVREITCPYLTLPRQSKLTDWLMYAIHDKTYLANKGIEKKWTYQREQVKCTDEKLWRAAWSAVGDDPSMNDIRKRIKHGLLAGKTFSEAVIDANPRPTEIRGCLEYAALLSNAMDSEHRQNVKLQKILMEKMKEQKEIETNGKLSEQEREQWYQQSIEELYRDTQNR